MLLSGQCKFWYWNETIIEKKKKISWYKVEALNCNCKYSLNQIKNMTSLSGTFSDNSNPPTLYRLFSTPSSLRLVSGHASHRFTWRPRPSPSENHRKSFVFSSPVSLYEATKMDSSGALMGPSENEKPNPDMANEEASSENFSRRLIYHKVSSIMLTPDFTSTL